MYSSSGAGSNLQVSGNVSVTPMRKAGVGASPKYPPTSAGASATKLLPHSSASESHMEEMIRIHKLWQDTKDELRAAVRARDTVVRDWEEDRVRLEHEHKQHMHATLQENDLLKAENRARIDQLNSARKENDSLSKVTTELQHQLANTHDKYSEQLTQNMVLTNRVRELNETIAELRRSAARADDAEHSLNATREEVGIRERDIKTKDESINAQAQEITFLKNREKQQQFVIDAQKQEITDLYSRIKKSESDQETVALGEFRRSRKQIEKKLSKLHEDYSNVATILTSPGKSGAGSGSGDAKSRSPTRGKSPNKSFGDDSKHNASHASLHTSAVRNRRPATAGATTSGGKTEEDDEDAPIGGSAAGAGKGGARERDLSELNLSLGGLGGGGSGNVFPLGGMVGSMPRWIPPDMAELVKNFESKIKGHGVLHGSFTELLLTLNRIWRHRVAVRISELKKEHDTEVRALRRQLSQRIPYEQVVQKAQIVRLQRNLFKTRQSSAAAKSLKDDKAGSLLDLSLATVENLSRQLMDAENQSNLLRSQIDHLEEKLTDRHMERVYRSGVEWLLTRSVRALDLLDDKVWTVANDFLEKVIRIMRSDDFVSKFSVESQSFMDQLEQQVGATKSTIKASAAEADLDGGANDDD